MVLGQISIGHFTDIYLSCSRDEDARRQGRRLGWAKPLLVGPAESRHRLANCRYEISMIVAAAELAASISYFKSRGVKALLNGDPDLPSGVLAVGSPARAVREL